VAALVGSLAAALAAMVANVSVTKGQEHAAALSELAERAQDAKRALLDAVDEDTRAFNALMAAMRLPRATAADERARKSALQDATRRAALVPLETARVSLRAIELARDISRLGAKEAASDLGVAALAGRAAVEGAVLNVLTNLAGIDDDRFTAESRLEAERLTTSAREICDEAMVRVRGLFT
jgi:glutamate formiminotransferase/formiminotetrahydrofolate cyclodeaminase